MPIPPLDGISRVLPPHLGSPINRHEISPYLCTVEELCREFGSTLARNAILRGFLNLRSELRKLGVIGFHWIGGSMLEDTESLEGRDPRDIDVVTFSTNSKPRDLAALIQANNPKLLSQKQTSLEYKVDHYLTSFFSSPVQLHSETRYWYALFAHRRDNCWKGMLVIPLDTSTDDDDAAFQILLANTP